MGRRLSTALPNRRPRRCRVGAITQPMPSWAPISSAWPDEVGPAPITSCSATMSGSTEAITSAIRAGLVRPSSPRQRWML